MATFAELNGFELPDKAGPDSFSFYKVLTGEQSEKIPVRPSLALKAKNMMIRSGDWKLIDDLKSGGFSRGKVDGSKGAKGQLYNLKTDPGETTNLWLKHPEKVAELLQELERIKKAKQTRKW